MQVCHIRDQLERIVTIRSGLAEDATEAMVGITYYMRLRQSLVCHPIWAEGRRPYLGHRPLRVPIRWGRRWRLVGWEYGHSDSNFEATPP
jgi:hypothetical protein